MAPRPAAEPGQSGERKPRARKRPKGAATHVRSWPLRPDPGQCRVIGTRFFTGARVYNAVLEGFIGRSRAVKADPAWHAARQLPRRNKEERTARRAAFDVVAAAHGFSVGAAQSFASSLRRSWVREHLPAQETQNLGARAFDAVRQWHLGRRGKQRFKSTKRGLHSLAAKYGNGALRPKTDAAGRLTGLQWGSGFVVGVAASARTGRRGKEQQAELAEIEALIAAGKVLSTRIVRSVVNGRDTYRMQLVCDGHPSSGIRSATAGSPSTSARVKSRLRCSAVMERRRDGLTRWPVGSSWTPCGCAVLNATWIASTVPVRPTASTPTAPINRDGATGSSLARPSGPPFVPPSSTVGWPSIVGRCTGRWPTGCSPKVSTWRARSLITWLGRRTSRAVCATGHPGCSWR